MIRKSPSASCYIDPGTGFTIMNLGGWFMAGLLGFLGLFPFFFKFLKRNIKWIILLIAALVCLGAAIWGIAMNKKGSAFDHRVVIIGFDALSPDIIEPMMAEGKLPNFSRLKASGSYRRLSTTNPPQSPVAWSGFATGKNPGKNGVFDFIIRDPKNYGLELSLSRMNNGKPVRALAAKTFWEYASERRVPGTILACPVTFPPGKLDGRLLSGMGVPDIIGTEGTFTFYTTEASGSEPYAGGKVFSISALPVMVLNLIGPRVAGIGGKAKSVKVPFKAVPGPDDVLVEYQGRSVRLKVGQWSSWQEVEFDLGFLKRARGIFKFYLVEKEPYFKLYISPINFDPRSPLFPISYPKGYSKELAERIGLYYTQGMPMDTWAVNEGRLSEDAFLKQAEAVLCERKAMLDSEMNRFDKGIMFCYFESVDIIQHMFWRYTDPSHPLYEKNAPKEYKEMIESWYVKMDDILGDVLGRMREDDKLIVLSDHGFGSFRRAAHVNSWLKANGYLYLKNEYADSGAELLADIDWSKTKAYAIGFGAIYVNQKGRERDGIVEAGPEAQALKAEIAGRLEGWTDGEAGRRIVQKAYLREEIFRGPRASDTPDVYIGFNEGYRASWQTAMGGVPNVLVEDNLKKWSGDHLIDPNLVRGVIFANKEISGNDPSIYDITPTVLKVIGYDEESLKACDFDGKPLW